VIVQLRPFQVTAWCRAVMGIRFLANDFPTVAGAVVAVAAAAAAR